MMETGELPAGWKLMPLGEVASVSAGTTAPQGSEFFEAGVFPFVRAQDVGRYGRTSCLTDTKDKVNQRAVSEKRLKLARKGAVLFPKSGASILTNSRAKLGTDAYVVSHLAIVEGSPELLDDDYLYHWLCTLDMSESVQSEEGYPSLRLSDISAFEIRVPPLAEQRRLVARIEALTNRLEQARQARRHALAEGETVIQAAMQAAFDSADDVNEAPLGALCTMKTGKTPPTSHPEYFEGDVPFVCPADVGQSLRITTAARHLSPHAVTDGKANLFPSGTVLLVGIGSTVGKVGLAAADVCTNQQITGLTFRKGIFPDYAAWFLTSQRAVIENAASDGGVPIINQNGMGQLSFRFPESTAEQRAIVARLDALRGKLDELQRLQRETGAELAAFTPALLAKAFKGEL